MAYKEITLDRRFRNCLQTILEIEESLVGSDLGSVLNREFLILKEIAGTMDFASVKESDVKRIEVATTHFLYELSQSATKSDSDIKPLSQVLQ